MNKMLNTIKTETEGRLAIDTNRLSAVKKKRKSNETVMNQESENQYNKLCTLLYPMFILYILFADLSIGLVENS